MTAMTVIRDQRTMIGARRLTTVEEVEAAWHRRARQGFEERGDEPGLIDATVGPPLVAYVNNGRWVADCPICPGGIAGWPENPRGACLSCGTVFRLAFPDADLIVEIEALLLERATLHRNYDPRTETLDTLRAENAVKGPVDADFAALMASFTEPFTGGD